MNSTRRQSHREFLYGEGLPFTLSARNTILLGGGYQRGAASSRTPLRQSGIANRREERCVNTGTRNPRQPISSPVAETPLCRTPYVQISAALTTPAPDRMWRDLSLARRNPADVEALRVQQQHTHGVVNTTVRAR